MVIEMIDNVVFGIDLGGTTVKIGVFTGEGTLLENWEIPTRINDKGTHILPDIADSIKAKIAEKKLSKESIVGAGIGVPGPVDAQGNILGAINLGWGTFNIESTLEALLDMPVNAANDANVAALGEMWKGGGMGYTDIVAVTLGTGVGGGIIINGEVLAGATGAGGEIGHIHVQDGEESVCGCGNCGCLEQYASATGIVTLALRRLAKDDTDSILREGEVTAKHVWDAVKKDDIVAKEIATEFGDYLGKGLASIAAVVNPQAFVIGGGVSKAGEILFDYIEPVYQKYVFKGCRNAKFMLAELGNDAGIYGAAKLVLHEEEEN